MTATQILTIMRNHTAVRMGTERACVCGSGGQMSPYEHTAHVAEEISRAIRYGQSAGDDRYVLRADEVDGHHIGYELTVPVPGSGASAATDDVTGQLTRVGRWDTPLGDMVELTLYQHSPYRERTYVVRPDVWVSARLAT